MEEIEQRAEQVLAGLPDWLWDGESLPVPVEDIADSRFGLRVCDRDDLDAVPGAPEMEPGQSLSGLLLERRAEIWVNADEARQWPPRRRFTIGHELGHWVLHRSGRRKLFCRASTVQPEERVGEKPELGRIEEEANVFAAALLMPARLLREQYEECGGDFEELCRRFDSSGAAMGRRLHAAVPRSGPTQAERSI
jgi:IrrE N-terminal-like domain